MTLDSRTVVLTTSLVNIAPALVFYFLHRRVKGKIKGAFLWFVSYSLLLAGSALVALRGAIPDLISILLSNVIFFVAFFLLYAGLAQFLGLRPWFRVGISIVSVAVILIGVFTVSVPSVKSRIFVYSAAALMTSLINAYLLLSRAPLPLRVSARLAAFMNLGQALVQAYRILIVVPANRGNDLFQLSTPETLYLVMSLVFVIGLSLSFLQLVNARLVVDLESSLSLQKTLLNEVRHRTKNNLVLVDSIMGLQLRAIKESSARALLDTLRNRVRAIGLVHDRLDEGGAGQIIRADNYISAVVEGFRTSLIPKGTRVKIKTDIEPLELETETAIPLGLIVNELLTNALKHAFSNGRRGEIRVSLSTEAGGFRLAVRDNGKGLGGKNADGLGMTIVHALAEQLGGSLTIEGSSGTSVELAFEIPACESGRRPS